MNDATPPQRKVVKRVVRKTVVRPADGAAATARRGSTSRPGALTSPAAPSSATPSSATPSPAAEPRPAEERSELVAAAVTAPERDTVEARPAGTPAGPGRRDVRDLLDGARDGVVDAGLWIVDRVQDVRDLSADAADALVDRVRAWELPPRRVAAIVGAAAGLAAVGLGALALVLSSGLRDRTAGGGWGLLTFAGICAVTIVGAGWALRGVGIESGRVVALIGTLLTVAALLVFFVDSGQSPSMLLIVPALMAAAFPASLWLLETAQDDAETA